MEEFRPTSTLRFMGIPLKTSRFIPKGLAVMVDHKYAMNVVDLTYRIPLHSLDSILGCKDITLSFNTERFDPPMPTPLPKKRYTVAINGTNRVSTYYPNSPFSRKCASQPDTRDLSLAFAFQSATEAARWIADRLCEVRKFDPSVSSEIYSVLEITETYTPSRTTKLV